MNDVDVVIFVPLNEEFETISEVFGIQDSFVENKVTFYRLAPPPGKEDLSIVAVVLNRMGNPTAAQKTERVLSMIGPPGPELVALVGIAGGLDSNYRLGDVIIADQVTNYGSCRKAV